MMTRTYNEIYLDNAMQTLGEVFSYVGNEEDADTFFHAFVMNGIAYHFGRGNPCYLIMLSQVIVDEVASNGLTIIKPSAYLRSKEY